jgi:hypothetical protein
VPRGAVVAAVLAVLAASTAMAAAGDAAVTAPSPARVAVNFGAFQGPLWHPERFNNFTRRNLFPAQRPGDAAYLNATGVHGAVYRVWLAPDGVCTQSTTSCTFPDDVRTYFKAASTVSDSILLDTRVGDLIDPSRDGGTLSPAQVKPIIKRIIKTAKANYPKLTYIEPFNEPDAPSARAYLTPAKVYPYYRVVAQAVNEVNAELKPDVRLQVGGAAFFEFDPTWIGRFLSDYAADPDPAKRLDFFSYHGYLEFGDMATLEDPHFYKDDPSRVAGQRARLESMLEARGIDPHLPAFITEAGMYPGPLFDDQLSGAAQPCPPAEGEPGLPTCDKYFTTDYLRQAAGMASLGYWYAQQPDTYMFNWTTRHSDNPRKDQFVTRVPKGRAIPTNTLTPYGNLLVMQAKMKPWKVAASSDSLTKGIGVYAVASRTGDGKAASIMVWNYQGCGAAVPGDPCTNDRTYRATVAMTHLPANLVGHTVHERVFRIDQTTSNYYATPATDPSHADLQQVAGRTFTPATSYTKAVNLAPNAIYLILLGP